MDIKSIFYDKVFEFTGIYPQAIIKNGVEHKRTEWQEGWNACFSDINERFAKLESWWEALPQNETKEKLEKLLTEDNLFLHAGKEVRMSVNCSDLFFWACSDFEEITMEEIGDLINCYNETQFGGELWCCRKRKMRPQSAYYDLIPKTEWALFDAAGEERDDPDGKRA